MDRKTFLQRFGMGAAGIILAPKIVSASLIKPSNPIVSDNKINWRLNEIFIRVVNNNRVPVDVMLFGVNQSISRNFVPEGVKIFIAGATYQELQSAILYAPVRIQGLRLQVKDTMQFTNPFSIWDVQPNGSSSNMQFQPINYISAFSNNPYIIVDAPNFELLLTPSVYIMNKVNANEQVDYVFSVANKTNITSILRSKI